MPWTNVTEYTWDMPWSYWTMVFVLLQTIHVEAKYIMWNTLNSRRNMAEWMKCCEAILLPRRELPWTTQQYHCTTKSGVNWTKISGTPSTGIQKTRNATRQLILQTWTSLNNYLCTVKSDLNWIKICEIAWTIIVEYMKFNEATYIIHTWTYLNTHHWTGTGKWVSLSLHLYLCVRERARARVCVWYVRVPFKTILLLMHSFNFCSQ